MYLSFSVDFGVGPFCKGTLTQAENKGKGKTTKGNEENDENSKQGKKATITSNPKLTSHDISLAISALILNRFTGNLVAICLRSAAVLRSPNHCVLAIWGHHLGI